MYIHSPLSLRRTFAFCALLCAVFVSRSALGQPTEVVRAAISLGLTPEALVVADVSPDEAQMVLRHLLESPDERATLSALQQDLDTQLGLATQIRQLLAQDPDNADLRQQLETAQATITGLRTSIEAQREALIDIALDGRTQAQTEDVWTFVRSSGYKVGPEYRIRQRSEETWTMLERALRAEARATRRGEDLDHEYLVLLTDIRSDPEIHYARTRLDQGLAAMEAVFGID